MNEKTYTIELSGQEAALIGLCRKIGNGYIEGIGLTKGQPTTLKGVTQRLDLSKPEDLNNVLADVAGTFLIDQAPELPGITESSQEE